MPASPSSSQRTLSHLESAKAIQISLPVFNAYVTGWHFSMPGQLVHNYPQCCFDSDNGTAVICQHFQHASHMPLPAVNFCFKAQLPDRTNYQCPRKMKKKKQTHPSPRLSTSTLIFHSVAAMNAGSIKTFPPSLNDVFIRSGKALYHVAYQISTAKLHGNLDYEFQTPDGLKFFREVIGAPLSA